jgi:2-methylcitrate dehydratase PrpD
MGAVGTLAEFVTSFDYTRLPEDVRIDAKIRLLDLVGNLFAGCGRPRDPRLAELIRELSQGDGATFWLSGQRGSVKDCAFVNSLVVALGGQDDGGRGGHPGVNVVPAAVVVAEHFGSTGAELLAAIALGYEVQVRLASSDASADISDVVGDRGLRGTTVTGALGAAAAASSLMKLDAGMTAHALAFAASLCVPGIEEAVLQSTDEPRIQTAANTRNGVLAAGLAQAGFVGADSALEGECGFYAAFSGTPGLPTEALANLATDWITPRFVYSKPYPAADGTLGPSTASSRSSGSTRLTPTKSIGSRSCTRGGGATSGTSTPGRLPPHGRPSSAVRMSSLRPSCLAPTTGTPSTTAWATRESTVWRPG